MTSIRSLQPPIPPRSPARLRAGTALLALGSAGLLNACGGGSAPGASAAPASVAPHKAPPGQSASPGTSHHPVLTPEQAPEHVPEQPPEPTPAPAPGSNPAAAAPPGGPFTPASAPSGQGNELHIRVRGLPDSSSVRILAGARGAQLRGSGDFELRPAFPAGSVQRLRVARQPRAAQCRFDTAQVTLGRSPGTPARAELRCQASRRAFVLLSGGFVQSFAVGPGGRLKALSGQALAVGAQARALAVSADARRVYVAGGAQANTLSIVDVRSDGNLRLLQTLALPRRATPVALAMSPDGSTLFAACSWDRRVLSFAVNPSTGALSALGAVSTATADGRLPRRFLQAHPGQATGASSAPVVVDPSMVPDRLAVDPRGRYLYVGGRDGSVEAFGIVPAMTRSPRPPTGDRPWALRWLTRGKPFGARGRLALACDSEGNLLVADSADPAVKFLAAPGVPGSLPAASSRGAARYPWRSARVGTVLRGAAQGLSFNPRTRSLYVSVLDAANGWNSAIQVFRESPGEGGELQALTPPTTPWVRPSALGAIAVAPGGASVYALDAEGPDLAQYRVAAPAGGPALRGPGASPPRLQGLPQAMSPASVPTLAAPVAIALQP